jgi:hypothetical protein
MPLAGLPFLYSKRTAAARSLVSLIESERFVAVLSELAVELPCRGLARAFLYLLDRRENTHIFLIIGACLRFLVLRTYVVFKNRAFYRGLAHALLYLSRREKTCTLLTSVGAEHICSRVSLFLAFRARGHIYTFGSNT